MNQNQSRFNHHATAKTRIKACLKKGFRIVNEYSEKEGKSEVTILTYGMIGGDKIIQKSITVRDSSLSLCYGANSYPILKTSNGLMFFIPFTEIKEVIGINGENCRNLTGKFWQEILSV